MNSSLQYTSQYHFVKSIPRFTVRLFIIALLDTLLLHVGIMCNWLSNDLETLFLHPSNGLVFTDGLFSVYHHN